MQTTVFEHHHFLQGCAIPSFSLSTILQVLCSIMQIMLYVSQIWQILVDYWRSDSSLELMKEKHDKRIYPPRIKITVKSKKPDVPLIKLPIRFQGCSMDEILDEDLIVPSSKYFQKCGKSKSPSFSIGTTSPQATANTCSSSRSSANKSCSTLI